MGSLLLWAVALVSVYRLDLGVLRAMGLVHLSLRKVALEIRAGLVLDTGPSLGSGLGPLVLGL